MSGFIHFAEDKVFDFNAPDAKEYDRFIYSLLRTDNSAILYKKIKTESDKGGYFYKVISTEVFTAKTNKHGDKYLKSMWGEPRGAIYTRDVRGVRSNCALMPSGNEPLCEEGTEVLRNHVLRLLNFPINPDTFEGEVWNELVPQLMYPFLRDKKNAEFFADFLDQTGLTEIFNQRIPTEVASSVLSFVGPRGLDRALRESRTIEEFLSSLVYKTALKTGEDLQTLRSNLHLIPVFASYNLKMGANEAVKQGYAQLIQRSFTYVGMAEEKLIQFLLSYSSKEQLGEVWEFISELVGLRELVPTNPDSKMSWRRWLYGEVATIQKFIQTTPIADKQTVAVHLLQALKTQLNELRVALEDDEFIANLPRSIDRISFKTGNLYSGALVSTLNERYSQSSFDSCLATAKSLFGIDLLSAGSKMFFKCEDEGPEGHRDIFRKRTTSMYRFYEYRGEVSEDDYLFASIESMVNLSISDYVYSNAITCQRNKVGFDGDVYLPNDLEAYLVKASVKIDTILTKVGRPLTPENRVRYLRADPYMRNYKVNWNYYDADVPAYYLPSFKEKGIKSKKDIHLWMETYDSCSQEMFEELLGIRKSPLMMSI